MAGIPARRSTRHGAVTPARKYGPWLAGLLTLFILAGVGFFLFLSGGARTAQTASASSAPTADRCASTTMASSRRCASPLATDSPATSAATTARRTPSASPSATRTKAGASPPASPAAPSPAPPPAEPAGSQRGVPAEQVLAVINQARAAAGLPAYTVSSGLNLSASRHNTVMASGCGLSHQCPGEAALGARETAAGVTWTSAGENIGEGGPVASSTTAIAQMAVTLTQDMLAEKPPDDGHRLNILSSAFHHIGSPCTGTAPARSG